MTTRQNIKTPGLIEKYVDGCLKLKQTPHTSSRFPEVTNVYDAYIFTHFANIELVHFTPLFLPWHRAFLMSFEMSLQAVLNDSNFSLPYWDWIQDQADPIGKNSIFQPGYVGAGTNPVSNGPFAGAENWKTIDPGHQYGDYLQRTLYSEAMDAWYPTRPCVDLLFNSTTYDQFRFDIETGPHNFLHDWVGGQMGSVTSSVNDPAFFLHHANIDRIWAEFQNMYPLIPVIAPLFPSFNENTLMPTVFDEEPPQPVSSVLSVIPSQYQYDIYYQPKLKGVCVHRGMGWDQDNDPIIWTQYFNDDDGTWSPGTETGAKSDCTPSIATHKGETLCTYIGADGDKRIYTSFFDAESQNWGAPISSKLFSDDGPAVSTHSVNLFESTIYMVFRRTNTHLMSWCVWDWFDGNWGAERELTFETNDTPALIEFRQTLFLVHKGGSDDDIWWSTLSGEGGFQPEKTYGGRSYSGVGLAVFKDTLFMVHRGKEDDQGLYWTYLNPTSGSFEQDKPFTNGNRSYRGPSLFVSKDNMYCLHRGEVGRMSADQYLYCSQWDKVTQTWSTDVSFDTTSVQPGSTTISLSKNN